MGCRSDFTAGLIGVVLLMVAVPTRGGEQGPISPEADDVGSVIRTEHFTLHSGKDFPEDAQKAKAYLDSAIASLRREFSDYAPEEILKKVDCHVYLHPKPNELAFDGRSVCITDDRADGRRFVELHFLTPAAYDSASIDSIGERKKDDHHFFRYIIHEYSPVFIGGIVRAKKKGWYVNGHDAPNWFWQGYEEYLGMTLSSEHSRTITFAKYMAVLKKDPDRVMIAYGYRDKTPRIVVQGDYTDGFTLLAFMHQRFGKKAVQSLLASEKETFWDALTDVSRVDIPKFYEMYQEWVHAWQGPTMSIGD